MTIAIIGAGVAGITCGDALSAGGRDVVVFEKSRGIGGRLATRRINDTPCFDHGAPYFTAQSKAFKSFLSTAGIEATVAPWQPRTSHHHIDSLNLLVGVPTASAFLKPVAEKLEVRLNIQIRRLEKISAAWNLVDTDGTSFGPFEKVIITAPAPQATSLLAGHKDIKSLVGGASLAPCWTTLVAFDAPLPVPFDIWTPTEDQNQGILAKAIRNGAKPGRRADLDCWVLHAQEKWTRGYLEQEKSDAADAMLKAFWSELAVPPREPVHLAGHRWRYARTATPSGGPFGKSVDGTIYTGGDWRLGPTIEDAYSSGRAIANDILLGQSA
ncbi:MAG: FAD-dependent oxidoreductase [Pseudomonadota bacterium]